MEEVTSRPCPLPFDLWWGELAPMAPFEEVARLLWHSKTRVLARALLKGYREWEGRADQLPGGDDPSAHQFVKSVRVFPDLEQSDVDLAPVARAFPGCKARVFSGVGEHLSLLSSASL